MDDLLIKKEINMVQEFSLRDLMNWIHSVNVRKDQTTR